LTTHSPLSPPILFSPFLPPQTLESIYALKPHLEPTLILVPEFIKDSVAEFGASIGFDYDTLSMTLGLFLCYPLGMIMNFLPFGMTKHFFSFFLGAFLLQFTIGVQWMHQLVSSLVAYFLLAVLPAKYSRFIVPFFAIAYCTCGHLHRQYVNYLGWDMDFTGAQMVLTMKLWMISFNLYDGQVLASGRVLGDRDASKKCAKFALFELPSLIEFLGYTFCFSSVLAGPSFEYKTYADACDGNLLYDPKTGKARGKIPSVIWPTLQALIVSLMCMGAFVLGSAQFPLMDPVDGQKNEPVMITAEFLAKPLLHRYAYCWIGLLFLRMKYYFAWKNAEGANNIWYAGFDGFDADGKAKGWTNACNIDIFGFEFGHNLKNISAAWNKKTANWLGRYIYMRTNGSLVATYSTSAFWHGFYPGYYFFFLTMPVATECERLARKKISPHFSSSNNSLYTAACIMCCSFVLNYYILPFQVLAYSWGVRAWDSFYYFGHVGCIVWIVVGNLLPSPRRKEKKDDDAVSNSGKTSPRKRSVSPKSKRKSVSPKGKRKSKAA
jgi:hypothetical protein